MRNILDLQVLFTAHRFMTGAMGGVANAYLTGFARALDKVLPYAEKMRMKGIKLAGTSLFAKEKGGDSAIWRKRPLPPVLIQYCASDVVHMFAMLDKWGSVIDRHTLRAVSEQRMTSRIDAAEVVQGAHLAMIDFTFPADFHAAIKERVAADASQHQDGGNHKRRRCE